MGYKKNEEKKEWDTSTNTDTKYCAQYIVKLKRQTEEQYVQYACLYEEDR